ncbi:MAG: two-component regulator propeller domain-containing protein [Bacteroidota bacterium]
MRIFYLILFSLSCAGAVGQNFTFNRFSTEDGLGLLSNVVSSVYQDEKGFIWVGTANGLQRFDGRKFIQFSTEKPGSDKMPDASIHQVIPADSGKLFIAFTGIREFGIFDPSYFTYRKIKLQTNKSIPAGAGFFLWLDAAGELYLNVSGYGILQYSKAANSFQDNHPFPLPRGWKNALSGVYEEVQKKQVWFATDSGLCIFDRNTESAWTWKHNPNGLALLDNPSARKKISAVHVDHQKRIWLFGDAVSPGSQQLKICLDSAGTTFLHQDTIGLNAGSAGYSTVNHIYETKNGNLWFYGMEALFNFNNGLKRFQFHKSSIGNDNINISYETINQATEDKDGGIWVATDQGLYFTALGTAAYSVVNLIFDNRKSSTYITDILELPNNQYWITSWGSGVKSVSAAFEKIDNNVYADLPPASWTAEAKDDIKNTWCMARESATGEVWIGCSSGIILVHNLAKKTTRYLQPEVFDHSAIRYITEDMEGNLWFGTEEGKLIRYHGGEFTEILNLETIIYKVFIDRQGLIWLSTHAKGFYAVHPGTGHIIQHYTKNETANSLFSNSGNDIEQLNDSVIVLGAGALNFVNKKRQTVQLVTYADGLPSNTVERLRMDGNGFLWVITANGLCRYNPINHRIMPYGKKDGIVLGEKTNSADLKLSNGYLMFAGSNALIMFHPAVYSMNTMPPPVTITDFKIFNEFQPIDSIMQQGLVRLQNNQNSFSIFFASLSYIQRDRLTYYYKLEGLDKDWIKADKSAFVNYSLLPPGNYTFKIYCENIEGQRSESTTEIKIVIKPPFWSTKWFISTVLFFIALIIYALHDMRVQRLLAVEKLRTRVARDLHDDMGSTLSTINILSAMAKSKMKTDALKTTEYLAKITDNSQRMMDAMDDIVWSIKPSNDSMQKIVARMREFAINVLEPKDIALEFIIDEEVYDIKLNMEARRDFFLVFKEAVNNSAKYSKAEKLVLTITVRNKVLLLVVKDNGIGFDVAAADNGNGLGNMQKRADGMNGKVAIHSKAGEGTEIVFKVPLV